MNPLHYRTVLILLVASLGLATGCGDREVQDDGYKVELDLDPATPTVGQAKAAILLLDPTGQPVKNAEVRLEGNMNHAGMRPSFAELSESTDQAGRYEGQLDFTMGGDWFVLVTAKLSDGKTVERTIDVPGVESR